MDRISNLPDIWRYIWTVGYPFARFDRITDIRQTWYYTVYSPHHCLLIPPYNISTQGDALWRILMLMDRISNLPNIWRYIWTVGYPFARLGRFMDIRQTWILHRIFAQILPSYSALQYFYTRRCSIFYSGWTGYQMGRMWSWPNIWPPDIHHLGQFPDIRQTWILHQIFARFELFDNFV